LRLEPPLLLYRRTALYCTVPREEKQRRREAFDGWICPPASITLCGNRWSYVGSSLHALLCLDVPCCATKIPRIARQRREQDGSKQTQKINAMTGGLSRGKLIVAVLTRPRRSRRPQYCLLRCVEGDKVA